MAKRTFVDAPRDQRCTAIVTLKDGSLADCGRYRKIGDLCTQHAKMADRKFGPTIKKWCRRCDQNTYHDRAGCLGVGCGKIDLHL